MQPAVVRPAEAADLGRVAAIYAHYVTDSVATFEEDPPAVSAWEQRLADLSARGLPFLVAEAGAGVCGYAYASPWRPKPAYRHTAEDSVYLAPGYTGHGIGSALLGNLLSDCTAAGTRQLIAVIADTGLDASAALHARHGFTVAGRLAAVGHKHGRWIDTMLMQRDLTDRSQQPDREPVLPGDGRLLRQSGDHGGAGAEHHLGHPDGVRRVT